ncbi:MAG: transcriptional initiation protein Tat [Sphingobacteriales bacterium 50-39]|nr:gluconate 2-dehydrogenase subunit 3 family protein [Sphingobacteriales bacterium]OJW55336.1 MAG: transcriptional initiation protein Tat [Sphingobacteriales bacterium 50-39]
MDRRKSIKALIVGTVSTGVLVEACNPGEEKKEEASKSADAAASPETNRMKEEDEHYKEVVAKTYFTPDEMATITILGDIIIPKDEHSGSASDAKVPEFIEFIVKDKPEHKIPMRGGLRWLDVQCLNRYSKSFKDCSRQQQIEMVDEIAWPEKAKPEMAQGVSFFNLMRNLVSTGFFTSQMGVKDLGYMGNVPNQWNGVPDDVLKQYGLAYTEKELKECVSFS